MSHFSFLLLVTFILSFNSSFSQKKWDGGGGNNAWSNALNWTGNTLPSSSDNVVLDNSILTSNYAVLLPATAVTVRSITITPGLNRQIELTLPKTNTLAPGLRVTGPGYGMVLNSGAIFRNSSGLASGNAVDVTDSIRINNNGRYIHNSIGSHATNVLRLARVGGTESGIFEFDIPAASSTISFSGRTFGRLVLKAVAAGGSCNYTAAGTSRVLIRNNLELDAGVNFNLNFSDTIFVYGNFSQASGTFNVGNAPRSVVVHVSGNFTQGAGGIITETGTGTQSIMLAAPVLQLMSVQGSWLNQVALVKSGEGSVLLKSDLSLPFRLVLNSGRIITTDAWLLTLQRACTVHADSLSPSGFIDGPMRKEGLVNSAFLFPVGGNLQKRWLRLEQATGVFTVQYFRADPNTLSVNKGAGLHHISSVEYWNVTSTILASAVIKLSFVDPQSGGVTDMSALRVARLNNGIWHNAGNTNYSGTPGSNGWVSSTTAGGFSANTRSFALASAISQENPLPVFELSFRARNTHGKLFFSWHVNGNEGEIESFEIQGSDEGIRYSTIKIINAENGRTDYTAELIPSAVKKYYRIRMKNRHGTVWHESTAVEIKRPKTNRMQITGGNIIASMLTVAFSSTKTAGVLYIYNSSGQVQLMKPINIDAGYSAISVDVSALAAGIYILKYKSADGRSEVLKWKKR